MNRGTDTEGTDDVLRGLGGQPSSAGDLLGIGNPREDGLVSLEEGDVMAAGDGAHIADDSRSTTEIASHPSLMILMLMKM